MHRKTFSKLSNKRKLYFRAIFEKKSQRIWAQRKNGVMSTVAGSERVRLVRSGQPFFRKKLFFEKNHSDKMGSNSGGSLTRPIFVLGLGIIFGAVISFLTKRKRDQLENKTQTNQSETIQKPSNQIEEEPVGCCGGGSCGDQKESDKPDSQSTCGTGSGNSGGCGTGTCSTGNGEISKVQKIHFLIGSKTGAASKFANDVYNYIQAFNTTMKLVKSDIDSGKIFKMIHTGFHSLIHSKCDPF